MEKFEFKVDTNTLYVKTLRFIGAFMVGMVVGVTIIKFRSGSEIDWIATLTSIILGGVFAVYPGSSKKKSLTIDEEGIHLHHYRLSLLQKQREKIRWNNISAIKVEKNIIIIKNNIGARETLKLPLHTKDQVTNLKNYLQDITDFKKVTYLA